MHTSIDEHFWKLVFYYISSWFSFEIIRTVAKRIKSKRVGIVRKFIVNLTFLWWIRRFPLLIVGVGGKGWTFVVRIVKANIADVHWAFYFAWDATVCESDIFSFDTYIGRRTDKGQRSVTYTMYRRVLILPMNILIVTNGLWVNTTFSVVWIRKWKMKWKSLVKPRECCI